MTVYDTQVEGVRLGMTGGGKVRNYQTKPKALGKTSTWLFGVTNEAKLVWAVMVLAAIESLAGECAFVGRKHSADSMRDCVAGRINFSVPTTLRDAPDGDGVDFAF